MADEITTETGETLVTEGEAEELVIESIVAVVVFDVESGSRLLVA